MFNKVIVDLVDSGDVNLCEDYHEYSREKIFRLMKIANKEICNILSYDLNDHSIKRLNLMLLNLNLLYEETK